MRDTEIQPGWGDDQVARAKAQCAVAAEAFRQRGGKYADWSHAAHYVLEGCRAPHIPKGCSGVEWEVRQNPNLVELANVDVDFDLLRSIAVAMGFPTI